MTITAKRISPNRCVTDVDLDDDPSDLKLIDALGGQGDLIILGQIFILGQSSSWEVLKTTAGDDLLIVGASPCVGTKPPQRQTCTLNDKQARALVEAVTTS